MKNKLREGILVVFIFFIVNWFCIADDYVFVIDTSGSMREKISRTDPRIKISAVQEALSENLKSLPNNSRVMLISFNTRIVEEKEVVLMTDADRLACLKWVSNLKRHTESNGSTSLWKALRRALTIASEYAKGKPHSFVRVRVLTDGLDNDSDYKGKTADKVIEEFLHEFPLLDGESIKANIVLLGDLEMNIRFYPGVQVTRDTNISLIFPPVVQWIPEVVYSGSNVMFFDKTGFNYSYYDWYVDGQPVSRQSRFNYVFKNSGAHIVRLIVGTTDGLRESDEKIVNVLEPEKPVPLAPRIIYSPQTPEPGDIVRFVGMATGKDLSFSWIINGQTYKGAEVEYKFDKEGKYEIAFLVSEGARSEKTNITIDVVEKPLNVSISGPKEAISGQEVQFAAEIQPQARIAKIFWDFGDGTTSEENNPLHKYINTNDLPKEFNIVLHVTTLGGKSYNSLPHKILILPEKKPVPKPKAAFRILGTTFRVGQMISFQDESTGLINSYLWDFNGEAKDDRKNPEFRFESAGNKTIRLTVEGPGGTDTAAQTITVQSALISATFRWLNTNIQEVPIPTKLEFGKANVTHVRNRQLIINIDDSFEIIFPPEFPPDAEVVMSIDDALKEVFSLEKRVGETNTLATFPVSLRSSGRFRLFISENAPEGEHEGVLKISANGSDFLLNGKKEPIEIPIHINIVGTGGSVGLLMWIIIFLCLLSLVLIIVLKGTKLTYPIKIRIEEIPLNPTDNAQTLQPPQEFTLKRIGEMICLGNVQDYSNVFDVNLPEWIIMGKEKSIELFNKELKFAKKLISGEEVVVGDSIKRKLKIRFESISKKQKNNAYNQNQEGGKNKYG